VHAECAARTANPTDIQMHKSEKWLIVSAVALTAALACRELTGPSDGSLRVPNTVAKTTVPDPSTYTMSSAAYSYAELVNNNYLHPQWIVVKPNGPRFQLTGALPALPATQSVGATGAAGGRNGCDLNARISFGMVAYSFGECGQGAQWDTVLAQGQGFIRQGSSPLDYTSPDNSDCPPATTGSCHILELTSISFTVWPYPALMVPVTASPGAVPFSSVSYQQVNFTTAPNPPTLVVGGVTHADTMITTSWVYTAADGTLDGNMCTGGFPILTCSPYLHKSGRMVVKAFLGGWEQTSTISVQCLVTPADSVLNDTTSDFKVRDSILDLLVRSNADSAPDAGFNITHEWTGGWQHETKVQVWRLPDGGTEADTVPLAISDACTVGFYQPSPPVPNAHLLADFHVHQTKQYDPLYCNTTIRYHGRDIHIARTPTEAAQGRRQGYQEPDTSSADRADRSAANAISAANGGAVPAYVLKHGGWLLKISPVANDSLPNPQTWYRVFGGTATQQKCAWPRRS
jgi:hypothetical protein